MVATNAQQIMELGDRMSFKCIMKTKLLQGNLTTNRNHKCFKCDGAGRKCLIGYNLYLEYIKQQNEGGK